MDASPSPYRPQSTIGGAVSRRASLGILTKAAIGAALLPVSEASALFGLGKPANYEEFLHDLDLRYFRVDDILEAHDKCRSGVENTLPPEALWKNIRIALKVGDLAAEQLGTKRVRIISAYRCPAYNSRCSGASRASMHMKNLALDLRYDARPSRVVRVMRDLRSKGAFRGGIGSYRTFTHIDGRGSNVDW